MWLHATCELGGKLSQQLEQLLKAGNVENEKNHCRQHSMRYMYVCVYVILSEISITRITTYTRCILNTTH